MGWQFYELDHEAQKLVLAARDRNEKTLNQSFKMREAAAYGLERFWGEHLRWRDKGKQDERDKSPYWKGTWDAFVRIMAKTGVMIPNDPIPEPNDKEMVAKIQGMADKLWALSVDDQRVAIAVLTQLCDALVWWTQRYKGGREIGNDD